MALGLIHLNTGLAISFIKKIKHGQIADAIWEERALCGSRSPVSSSTC